MNLVNTWDLDPTEAWKPFQPTRERPWTHRLAAHLYRRAAFGGTIEQIVAAQQQGVEETVRQLLVQVDDSAIESEMAAAGRLVTGSADAKQLASWWLLRMIKTPCPFLEKMTLFWHGHFATGADKVMNARAMLRQNQLLRKHALGKYETLVKSISRDVAMLVYLDSEENRKTRPNENYARELMELFCLGPGNYTEQDIKEIARCFTGWEVRKSKFDFNQHQHDNRTKSFLGAEGNFNGDEAIDVVLQQPAASQFIAKKLIRFFVFEDRKITDEFAAPVATQLRDSEFDIGAAVKQILGSNVFFSDIAVAQKIKSPVELAIGFLRFFDASTNLSRLGQNMEAIGQLPLYPPNVKGWNGGRSWINASTILARANLISDILSNDKTKFASGSLQAWADQNSEHGVTGSIDWIDEFLLATPMNEQTRSTLANLSHAAQHKPGDLLSWLAAIPEFQLN